MPSSPPVFPVHCDDSCIILQRNVIVVLLPFGQAIVFLVKSENFQFNVLCLLTTVYCSFGVKKKICLHAFLFSSRNVTEVHLLRCSKKEMKLSGMTHFIMDILGYRHTNYRWGITNSHNVIRNGSGMGRKWF